jgi:hypothetical protein
VSPPTADTPDQPRARICYRQGIGFVSLLFLGASVPGIIANSNYSKVFDSQTDAADTSAKTRLVIFFLFLFIYI